MANSKLTHIIALAFEAALEGGFSVIEIELETERILAEELPCWAESEYFFGNAR